MLEALHTRLGATLGSGALELLHRLRVAVIGGGLLGGQILLHLAMLQIRTLVIDDGSVEPPNLGNQALPAEALGDPKARVRLQQMRALNPSSPVVARVARIEDLGLGVFADCDLLLTGLDSRASRLATNRIAARLGIDWIDAAVDGSGERLLGTVSRFRPGESGEPCYGCRFDAAGLADVSREVSRQPCASWRDTAAPDAPPTLVASPFGAVVAGMQTIWAVDALLGRGEDRVGRQLQIAGAGDPRVRSVALQRNRQCAFSHRRLDDLRRTDAPTLGALFAAAEADLGTPPDALRFPDRRLVFGLACPLCGETLEIVRWAQAVGDDEVICACGGTRVPRELSDRIEASRAREIADLGWSQLGVPQEDLVTATSADGDEVHYLLAPREAEEAA